MNELFKRIDQSSEKLDEIAYLLSEIKRKRNASSFEKKLDRIAQLLERIHSKKVKVSASNPNQEKIIKLLEYIILNTDFISKRKFKKRFD